VIAAGRHVVFREPIHVDQPLRRESVVQSLDEQQTGGGTIAILTASHWICAANSMHAAIEEEQTFVFLASSHSDRKSEPWTEPPEARTLGVFTPDDTHLFQFSALSFNTHRIHLDRDYARSVEGYPDLVVNGGLTTLLMTEYARRNLGLAAGTVTVTNKAPLFVDRPITFVSVPSETSSRILALDAEGVLAAEMEVQHNDV
jgi:3-methylfumaryl-CoA hydratase